MKQLLTTVLLCLCFSGNAQTKSQVNAYLLCTNLFNTGMLLNQSLQHLDDVNLSEQMEQAAYRDACQAQKAFDAIKSKLDKKDEGSIQEVISCYKKLSQETDYDGQKAASALVIMEIVRNKMGVVLPKLFK